MKKTFGDKGDKRELDIATFKIATFKRLIKTWYKKNRRDLPWRRTNDLYRILLSEVMLQQTQVSRVLIKYEEFLHAFPNMEDLARAPLRSILTVWRGMGYNRRALYLKQTAARLTKQLTAPKQNTPQTATHTAASIAEGRFPGIGPNTAASICAFAFNRPTIFIETNIRTVFLHHFFPRAKNVPDKQLLPLIAAALDKKNPREWYYALMDYGAMLKKTIGNPSRRSKHYATQSRFEGSARQLRGRIVKLLTQRTHLPLTAIATTLKKSPAALTPILASLARDGLIKKKNNLYAISA